MMFELIVQINGQWNYLDLLTTEEGDIFINLDNADVKEIDKRSSSFSKTIKLADSERNRQVLESISHINIDSNFNPNIKVQARILKDTIPQFEGTFILDKFDKGAGGFWTANIVGETLDLITILGDKRLEDLVSLDVYDHIWDKDNIRDSWEHTLQDGYVYPLIDYGRNWEYDQIQGGGINNFIKVGDMYPAIFERLIFDRILSEAGYSYRSQTLEREDLKKVVIPFTRSTLPGIDPDGHQFNAASTATQSIFTVGGAGNTGQWTILEAEDSIDFPDENDLWDETNNWYENNSTETISMRFNILMEFETLIADPQDAVEFRFIIVSSMNEDGSPNAAWDNPVGTPNPYGRIVSTSLNLYQYTIVTPSDFTLRNTEYVASSDTFISFFESDYITARPGEKFRFIFRLRERYAGGLPYINILRLNLSNTINPDAVPGTTLQMRRILPRNIRQLDFFKAIVDKYNLYVEPIKNENNLLLIETRDVYYSLGKVFDATQTDSLIQLDRSFNPIIEYIINKIDKDTIFTYKEDRDALNERYTTEWNEIYGQYRFQSPNENAKEEKIIQNLFSPTTLVQVNGSYIVIPSIVRDFNISTTGENTSKMDANIRCLYWGGLVKVNQLIEAGQRVQFMDQMILDGDGDYAYPYAGHLDNPYRPNRDLNFGLIKTAFFENEGLTQNNLFNIYWKNTMDSITNKNSKLVTIRAWLNVNFWTTFNLNDSIYLNIDGEGSYYFVNKITNWNPRRGDPCIIELFWTPDFKAPVLKPFLPGKGTINTTRPVRPNGDINIVGPVGTGGILVNVQDSATYSWTSGGGGIIVGPDNEVNSDGTVVVGTNNYVDWSTSNVNIFGNNNIVDNAAQGVTIIGDNVHATSSNTLYVSSTASFSGPVYFDEPIYIDGKQLENSRWLNPIDGLSSGPIEYLIVSNAGSTSSNGLYLEIDEYDGKPYYEGPNNEFNLIYWDGLEEKWFFVDVDSNILYFSDDDVLTPDLITTWQIDTGISPLPDMILSEIETIGTRYIVEESATGEFLAWDNDIAELTSDGWVQIPTYPGDAVRTKDDYSIYLRGDSWEFYDLRLLNEPTPTLAQVAAQGPGSGQAPTGPYHIIFQRALHRAETTYSHLSAGTFNLPLADTAWIRLSISADVNITYSGSITISKEWFLTLDGTSGTNDITWDTGKFRVPDDITLPSTISSGELWFLYGISIGGRLNFTVVSKMVDV